MRLSQNYQEPLDPNRIEYRLLFDRNPLPMWLFDPESLQFLKVNQAAVDIYGYSHEEFLGMTIADIHPPEDMERIRTTLDNSRGLENLGRWHHRLKDGAMIHAEITTENLLLDDRKVNLVVVNHITKGVVAGEELQKNLERFQYTLDHMLEGCQVIGYDWRYLYINETAARHGRRKPEELLGRTMMEAYPGIENTEMFSALRDCMEKRIPHRMENRFDNLDGSTGWFELRIEPVPEGIFILSIEVTERVLAEESARNQLARVSSLREIDLAILSTFDLRVMLETGLDQVISQLKADAADILLLDPEEKTLKFSTGRGFRFKAIEKTRLRVGEGHAGKAALEKRTVRVSKLSTTKEFSRSAFIEGEDFLEYFGTPSIVKGEVRGVLEVFQRTAFDPDPDWINFLEVLAGQIAIAIDNATLFHELRRSNAELELAYETTLEGWSAALDLRDKETEGHTQRVTTMTIELAKRIGLSSSELVNVRRGALLHDIGKMGVPDHILLKPDKLSEAEWEIMKKHPVYAYDLLSHIAYLRKALDIPYCHHEKWDGTGYPRGLEGANIPLTARIFSVVDVYDALTSDRPYRNRWPRERALEYIRAQSGLHFDPKVVDSFWEMINEADND